MVIDTSLLTKQLSFVQVNHKNLRVQQITHPLGANKPTLVFLHEGLGCIEMWKGFPEMLAAATQMNAVVYERQGYGQSDPLDLPRPMDYLEREALEWLPKVLEALHIKNPFLVGHSDGGSIALVYAGHYPCVGLISEAAHVFVEEVTLAGIEAVKGHPDLALIQQKLKKYHGEKTEAIFSAWADTWMSPGFRHWNIESHLGGISCPAFIIQGLDDEYATPLQVERILLGMSKSPLKKQLMPINCAHSPHLQAQQVVLAAMVDFVQEVCG